MTENSNQFKISKSGDFVYQIFPDYASIFSTTRFTESYTITHGSKSADFFCYEISDRIVFQFDDTEYHFDQTRKDVKIVKNSAIFRKISGELWVRKDGKDIHNFGPDIVAKKRTSDGLYCIGALDGHYVLKMFKYDRKNTINNTSVNRCIAQIVDGANLPKLIVSKETNSLFTLYNGVARFYNASNLKQVDEIPNVGALSDKFAVVCSEKHDEVYSILSVRDVCRFFMAREGARYHISGNVVFCVNCDEQDTLIIINIEKRSVTRFKFADAFDLCSDLEYLREKKCIMWNVNGIFVTMNVPYN